MHARTMGKHLCRETGRPTVSAKSINPILSSSTHMPGGKPNPAPPIHALDTYRTSIPGYNTPVRAANGRGVGTLRLIPVSYRRQAPGTR